MVERLKWSILQVFQRIEGYFWDMALWDSSNVCSNSLINSGGYLEFGRVPPIRGGGTSNSGEGYLEFGGMANFIALRGLNMKF